MSPPPDTAVFAAKLRAVADWVRQLGAQHESEALRDSIPFTLECLADESQALSMKTEEDRSCPP